MWTFCFLLPLLLYSVGIVTRDSRVVWYPVRDNARITIRGVRGNNRIAIRGARDNARSSIGGARGDAKIAIGGSRDNARSSIRVAVDGGSLQGSTLHPLRVRIGSMAFAEYEFEAHFHPDIRETLTNQFLHYIVVKLSLFA